jgi:hypothetical protein
VWSGVAQVVAAVPGPGRLELFALKPAGDAAPLLVVEAYDGDDAMVAGGLVAVWELNQAIAALLSETTQARRVTLRDDGRGHGGHLDVVADGAEVELTASARESDARVTFATTTKAFVTDLNALVRHYLALTRSTQVRTIELPDVRQESARAALSRPAPK